MKKILVGTDFSVAARGAVQVAAAWARREQAALNIVHVVPPRRLLAGLWHRGASSMVDAAHRHAREALKKLADEIDPSRQLEISTGLAVGAASAALRRMVQTYRPDVLVIGAHGEHEGAGEPSLGGTALKLLAAGPAPLLLVRTGAGAAPATVVAAVDLSPLSGEVLAWADRCVAGGGRVHAVHVWETPFAARLESYGLSPEAIDVYAGEEQRRRELELTSLVTTSSGEHATARLVVRGEPTARLLEQLRTLAPGLVVLGRHDPRRRRAAGSYGSVCRNLAFFAPTDVLIVPPASAPERP